MHFELKWKQKPTHAQERITYDDWSRTFLRENEYIFNFNNYFDAGILLHVIKAYDCIWRTQMLSHLVFVSVSISLLFHNLYHFS